VHWRGATLAFAVYVAAAVVLTWPLAINLTSRLGALQGPGDPYLNLWILGWGLHAWTSDPAGVFTGRVFDANIFFPAEGTLAYSDHFLLQALVLAPVYALTNDPVLCYNLLLIGSLALSGCAMHAFTRAVTGSTASAFVGGIAWACWPYRTAHLLHIQLQALYFMPLALLCLHRVIAARRWRDTLALGVVAALQAIASVYYGVMTAGALIASSLILAIATGQWRSHRLWARLVVAAVIAAAVAAPVLLPYARAQQAEGFGRTLFEASNHSASWQSYTQVPPDNLVYGRTGVLDPGAPRAGSRDRRSVEHQMFPGFVLLGLAVLGVAFNIRRDSRPLVMSGLALVAVGLVLSLGPEGTRPLYAALHDNVMGFQAIRAPARFAVIAFAGLSLLAGLGMRTARIGRAKARPSIKLPSASLIVAMDGVEGRLKRARALARATPSTLSLILIGLLSLEYLNAPLPLAPAPQRPTAIGQWLAREPIPGAVLHVPLHGDIENTPYMVQSLEHHRPIVNGYSGQRPAFFSALVESLADFPSQDAFAALREIDVRFVVAPAPVAGAGNVRSPLVERVRFDDGVVYEVRWTAESLAALGEVTTPPPPPPGPIVFEAGESARYDVYWDTGPLNVPAGTATLTVVEGGRGATWRFEAYAETANWVSTFFQAQDQFVTTADEALQPLEHRREIREGRRQLNRTYIYNRAARHIRVGTSRDSALAADALTLPLTAEAARDALTAFYYVRTLPLNPGSIVTVPLNEAGATLVLQVAAAEQEAISHDGQTVAAIRLEPRLMRRIERRQPLAMTFWLSADGRRIPLRMILQGGFGRVRAELRTYRKN
jgi:hypothetical protein